MMEHFHSDVVAAVEDESVATFYDDTEPDVLMTMVEPSYPLHHPVHCYHVKVVQIEHMKGFYDELWILIVESMHEEVEEVQ